MLLPDLPLEPTYALSSSHLLKLKNANDNIDQIPAGQNVIRVLRSNSFAFPEEPFLAFGFDWDRAFLNSSLRKEPGINKKIIHSRINKQTNK